MKIKFHACETKVSWVWNFYFIVVSDDFREQFMKKSTEEITK